MNTNLQVRFEKEQEMEVQIKSLERKHETTLIEFIEMGHDREVGRQLELLDSKIDHLRRVYENHVEQTNNLIYG